jgi:hypothetical protein
MNHLHIIQLAQERAAELQGKTTRPDTWTLFARRRPAGQGLMRWLLRRLERPTPTPASNKRARS